MSLICFALQAQPPAAQGSLEEQLTEAIKVNEKGDDRLGDRGQVLKAYAQAGIIYSQRTLRSDFEDTYVLRKPANFLGHDLLAIIDDHGREAGDSESGCCPTEGFTVYVRIVGDDRNLRHFAEINRCDFSDGRELQGQLGVPQLWSQPPPHGQQRVALPAGTYGSLSCTSRNLEPTD